MRISDGVQTCALPIWGHPRIARAGALAVAAATLAAVVAVLGAIAPRAVRHLADLLEKVPQSPRTAAGHAGVIFVAHTAFIGAAGALNRGCARKWLEIRSEERRGGKECVSKLSTGWETYHTKQKQKK